MHKILFECHHLYYFPGFSPIIKELEKRGNYDITVSIPFSMSNFEKSSLRKAAAGMNVSFIEDDSEKDRIITLKNEEFDAVFVGNVGKLNDIVSDDAIAVMVYHGIGLKQTYYKDINDRIDIRAVESENRFHELKASGNKNIFLVGYTKVDPLFNHTISRKEILGKIGLDPDKDTVLYAPSFYPSAIDQILPELKPLSSVANIIVKLHQFSWHQSRFKHHHEIVQKFSQKTENIVLLEKEAFDIIPYFASSDLLLSDISSTIFEYLPLNRPILLNEFYSLSLKHRLFRKRFNRKLDWDRLKDIDFARWVSNPDDVGTLIMDGLENSHELEKERKNALQQFLYKPDGNASSRLVDVLESKLKTGRN